MIHDSVSNNKIKENKYKILRMSLLLGADENNEETVNNFEDAAREIDAMNDEIYLKDLEDKFYDTKKLEDEEKKLSVLVDYIGGRVEQRISLLTDFANVTGFDLQNLPPIKYYDRLDDYKERLKYIREYLDNTNRLVTLESELQSANDELAKAYKNKAAAEEFNQRNEEILFNKFEQIVKELDYFKDIREDNVEEYLSRISNNVSESKKSLDIFKKSFTTLTHSGISLEEEQEYHSYVVNAEKAYYVDKEEEYLVRLYQLLMHKESTYHELLGKRDCVSDLLYERLELRKELGIEDNDILSVLYDLLEHQYEDIVHQKDTIESIDHLNEVIQQKKNEINELELDNQKVEILALLREFGVIDTYSSLNDLNTNDSVAEVDDSSDVKLENSDSVVDDKNDDVTIDSLKVEVPSVSFNNDVKQASEQDSNQDGSVSSIEEDYLDNQVIAVDDAVLVDLDLVHSKASKVMQRVGEMLGIKPKEDVVVSVSNELSNSEPNNPEVVAPEISMPSENPLFTNDIAPTLGETSVPDDENVGSVNDNSSIDNNFWFPSDTPDALNELPDLEGDNAKPADDNFFANDLGGLNFPDLKVDFGNNDTEEK